MPTIRFNVSKGSLLKYIPQWADEAQDLLTFRLADICSGEIAPSQRLTQSRSFLSFA